MVLALEGWPPAPGEWILLDSRRRSADFVAEMVASVGIRGVVVEGRRAEEVARGPLRESRDLVVSRGFGPPTVTAECGAAFLSLGGVMVVSEPPGSEGERWAEGPLRALGLAKEGVHRSISGRYMVLEKIGETPLRYPRRAGIPAKRPLF